MNKPPLQRITDLHDDIATVLYKSQYQFSAPGFRLVGKDELAGIVAIIRSNDVPNMLERLDNLFKHHNCQDYADELAYVEWIKKLSEKK